MSGDLAQQVAHELARTPTVSRVVGVFIEQDGNRGVVDVNGSQVKIPMVGYQPYPGTPVWVDTQNGRVVCAGSSYQFSPYATVMASPVSGKVRVQVDDGPELELPYRQGLTLTSGNRVEVNPVTRVVQGVISVVPDHPSAGGGGGTGVPFSNLLVQAADSGTSNGGGYWQNAVNSDSAAGGAWFYGDRLMSALAGVTQFASVEVYLPLIYSRYSMPTIMSHGAAGKPGSGLPAFLSPAALASAGGWVALPTAWGPAMRDAIVGVGFAPAGGVMASWRGTQSDAMSGAMRFSGVR